MSGELHFPDISALNEPEAQPRRQVMTPGRNDASVAQIRTSSPLQPASVEDNNVIDKLEPIDEVDLWTNRLILSSLENIVSSDQPNIPQNVIKYIKETLLDLKGQVLLSNPFSAEGERFNFGELQDAFSQLKLKFGADSDVTLSNSTLSTTLLQDNVNQNYSPSKISPEIKSVLRDLVEIQIRNLANHIIQIYAPVIDSSGTSSVGAEEDELIKEGMTKVNEFLKKTTAQNANLDKEIEETEQKIDQSIKELENGANSVEKIVKELKEKLESNICDEEAYNEYLRREEERLDLEIQIAKLEAEILSNPPELVEEVDKYYQELSSAVQKLELECEEKNKLIEKYEEGGEQFERLRKNYEAVEAEIASVEWAKEQLTGGNHRNSSRFSFGEDDSFNFP